MFEDDRRLLSLEGRIASTTVRNVSVEGSSEPSCTRRQSAASSHGRPVRATRSSRMLRCLLVVVVAFVVVAGEGTARGIERWRG